MRTMTAHEALTILEAAVLECKKRDINTPEVKNALDFVGAVHLAEVDHSTVSQPCREST